MKYWRGYLTAAILFACTWALESFAKTHTALMDMIYPYMTRMVQMFLAGWNSEVSFCLWQALVLAAAVAIIATVVLMAIFRWNPVRWFGWVSAIVALVMLLNTGIFGLNMYAGPLAEDIRLEETEYTVDELESAAAYFRDQANVLSTQVPRDSAGAVEYAAFEDLANQASDGFHSLVYDESLAVFAGPMQPVKKLKWSSQYSRQGITGVTVGLTGEAAVNPDIPQVMLPFAMCQEMAKRMSILIPKDASFGAYMACMANEDVQFRYSGALMGYRYCLKALEELDEVTGEGAAARVARQESLYVRMDILTCDEFFGNRQVADADTCDLLTSWHIQEIVLPALLEDEELFDPLDKSQVDLSDHPYA